MRVSIETINAQELFVYLNGERLLNCIEADEELGLVVIQHGESWRPVPESKQGIVQFLHVELAPTMEKVREELMRGFKAYPSKTSEPFLIQRILTALAIEKVNHEYTNQMSNDSADHKTALIFTREHFQ